MIIELQHRLAILSELGRQLTNTSTHLEKTIHEAVLRNPWFTKEHIEASLSAISNEYLNEQKLSSFASKYEIKPGQIKTVGLVLAGNIPLVGFHDVLCVFLSGNKALIKASEKDSVLINHLIETLIEIDKRAESYFEFVDQLKNFDAVIATGSNNTSTYFKKYFKEYPHIIRQNRNGVAVLTGEESRQDLHLLGQDIFTYFGLGCRNVSKVYLPRGYNFDVLMEELHRYNTVIHHNKYKNNFDYNIALFMLNKSTYFNNGSITFLESEQIPSRIASCHYSYYEDRSDLVNQLKSQSDQIQCIVTQMDGFPLPHFDFGQAQRPGLEDFADGIDTMQFLVKL